MRERAVTGSIPPRSAAAPAKKAPRGFAALDAEKRRQISVLGGKAAHAKGTAHEWDSEEAREAGRKGGLNSARHRAKIARDEVRERSGQ